MERNFKFGDEKMKFTEKTIKSESIYKGRILNVYVDDVELCDGKLTKREHMEHPGGVAVLPLLDNGDVVCVRQHRYPYHTEILEIPAGKLEYGEDPKSCGIRELKEETGYSAKEIISLGRAYPSPGYVNETLYLYLARGLSAGKSHPDEGEYLEIKKIPFDVLYEMVMNDEIHDAKTVIAILKTKEIISREKEV